MKAKEIRLLSTEELVQKERNIKKELYNLNYQRKMGSVEKPSRFQILKRDVARILTILTERDRENERSSKETK